MKEIYNEGRVVGLSTYELYLRQALGSNPDKTPLTERQWLAANLSESCSMILKVPEGTTKGYHDYILPENSDLCSCTVLYGSIFEGEVTVSEDGHWAVRVDDYSNLISNVHLSHPVTPGEPENVPTKPDPEQLTEKFMDRCRQYAKVSSGMMFQPGQWIPTTYYTPVLTESSEVIINQVGQELLAPARDVAIETKLDPDLTKRGFIRLAFTDNIEHDLYIFLHGFTSKLALTAAYSYTVGDVSTNPEDGDFLGPADYPWGVPIVLIVSNGDLWVRLNDIEWEQTEGLAPVKARVTALERQTATLETTCSTLTDTCRTLQDDYSYVQADLEQTTQRVTVAESSIAAEQVAISSLSSRCTTNETNIASTATRCTSLESRCTTTEANVSTAQNNISSLQTQCNTIGNDVSAAQADISSLETTTTTLQTKTSNLESRTASVETKTTSLENTSAALETRCSSIEGNITTIDNSIATMDQNIATIDQNISSITIDTSGLELKCAELESRCEALESDDSNVEARCAELESRCDALESADINLESRFSDLDSRFGSLELRCNGIEDSVQSMEPTVAANSNAISSLEPTVSSHTSSISTLTSDFNNLNNRLSAIEQDYATQSWVLQQGFLTDVSLDDYATRAWVAGQGYATQTWVGQQGFATQTWVTDKGYATETWVSNNFINQSFIELVE